MSQALLKHVVASNLRKVPALKPGSTVKVFQKIKEGEKERTQIFQGLVIRVSSGANNNKTFTVRKVVEGVGVEKIFPFHSNRIEKIEVVKQGKIRRAKLYYMRDLQGKSARLREKGVEMGLLEETEVETAPIQTTEIPEPETEPTAEPTEHASEAVLGETQSAEEKEEK